MAGHSAGGVGVFDLLAKRPGVFSAAIPVASGYANDAVFEPLGETRLWAFHGHQDPLLSPFYSRISIQAMIRSGDAPIYLEPTGGHGGGFGDDQFLFDIFRDADNELYPWLFDGIQPSLAELIYDPANGNVKLDATRAPGGSISGFELASTRNVDFNPPATSEINGDPVTVDAKSLIYNAANNEGFTGIVDLGDILPPSLDFVELYDSLATFSYESPGTQSPRVFHVVIPPGTPSSADFDDDGLVTTTDIDLLVGEIVAGDDNLLFDVTGDGIVDTVDVTQWLSDAAAHNGFSQAFLPGDSNLDGTVDAVDLNELGINWRQEIAKWSEGDFTADGRVNSADLNLIGINWQQSIPMAATQGVPEPSGLLLTAVGLLLLWRRG